MPVAADKLPAFKCKGCGHLCDASAAGVNDTPAACPVCGKGAIHKPGGFDIDPSNWEVIGEHTPCHDRDAAENLERCKAALAALVAKEAHWKEHKAAVVAEYHVVADAHDALAKAGPSGERPADLDRHATELTRLRQKADDLTAAEWTPRDAAHKAKLEETIANGGRESGRGGPRHHTVGLRDRSKTFDRAG